MNNIGMLNAKKSIITLVNKLEGIGDEETSNKTKKIASSFMDDRSVDEDMEVQYPGSEM